MMGLEKPVTVEGFLTINQPTGGSIDPQGQPQVQTANRIPTLAEAEFDVRIGAGSTLPVSKSMEFQKAIGMYQMQLADDSFVWRKSGTSQWQEEMMRGKVYWMQKQAQAMEMQAAQAQNEAQAQGENLASEGELDAALAEGEATPPDEGE